MNKSSIIMYTTEDGLTKIETTFDEDTVWLSLDPVSYTHLSIFKRSTERLNGFVI